MTKNRAAAIIIRDGKVLLFHRQKPGRDYYILPGGGVELEESFEEACIREVKEETGLDVLASNNARGWVDLQAGGLILKSAVIPVRTSEEGPPWRENRCCSAL